MSCEMVSDLLLLYPITQNEHENAVHSHMLMLAHRLVQERMKMSLQNLLQFLWQRIIRGRSYRHLMLQVGYK